MVKKKNQVTIRSSAAEYLTYVASVGEQVDSIEMCCENGNICQWKCCLMERALKSIGKS